MQVLFIGGANEVGASCLALELDNTWILIDAGVRMDRTADPLPDLAQLEGKSLAAIFVTHAHADHIGALPLVHQAFPATPIYASRATGLLMEVMLTDALRVMERRAAEEMELPLYAPELVTSMLAMLRPLPVGNTCRIPELPTVAIEASRAGHIAGAISLSFAATDGTIVISGDISSTDQRTVLGVHPPSVERPDLLVLESTYGTRLHANRQAEEARFAQAVADGIGRGGHVLIPAFGLGRGQEVLLILQDAISKGQIPAFPIYVDGLVRRVCATYVLMPEALNPRLARQIRKGYQPFSNKMVRFVRDERERQRILAGPPACIVSSSGMLTGGPSAWYAMRIAGDAKASILITGYQDEESPGRRLLALAEQRETALELDGTTVAVRCHIAKYSLSAHADGGELAAYAAQLQPRQVALVHGDAEARAALCIRLGGKEVLLPRNGTALAVTSQSKKQTLKAPSTASLSPFPKAVGAGRPLMGADLKQLFEVVCQIPELRIVTARELAQIWYEEVNEKAVEEVISALTKETNQKYFVPQNAVVGAFRVRGKDEEGHPSPLSDLDGQILFLQVAPESAKPAMYCGPVPVAAIRVQLPKGEKARTRYPYSAILDVLGPLPSEIEEAGVAVYLETLMRQARVLRRSLSARTLASLCAEGTRYSLSDLCGLASVSPTDLVARLAVAKIVQQAPRLFALQVPVLDGDGQALYQLAPSWSEALLEPEPEVRQVADQHAILQVLERHLGQPADLYRRSIHPETGNVTLAFHFPKVAREKYAAAITAAAQESGVQISLAPQANQEALMKAAQAVLPQGVHTLRAPSFYLEREEVRLSCAGQRSEDMIAEAQQRFLEQTGWNLVIDYKDQNPTVASSVSVEAQPSPSTRQTEVWEMVKALQWAQQQFAKVPGYIRVGVEAGSRTLVPRFAFPDIARERYAALANEIETTTGWTVRFATQANQEALMRLAEQVLPEGLVRVDTASLYLDIHQVIVTCLGQAAHTAVQEAQDRFQSETGWQLIIQGVGGHALADEFPRPRMTQAQAMERASALLRGKADLYQVGADEKRKALWLHFHFPDVARRRYAEILEQIAAQTGWLVELRSSVHQKALLDVALRLLPPDLIIVGKKSVQPKLNALQLTCRGSISDADKAAIEQQFYEETNWSLVLAIIAPDSPHNSEAPTLRVPEAQALEFVRTHLQIASGHESQVGVDAARGLIWIINPEEMVTTEQIAHWEQSTGWKIKMAQGLA